MKPLNSVTIANRRLGLLRLYERKRIEQGLPPGPIERPAPTTLPNSRRLSDAEIAAAVEPFPDVERPRTRGECRDAPRPCPWSSCRHHNAFEVSQIGSLTPAFPGVEPWEIPETCSLDAADRGGMTLEEVGTILNLTRECIRQTEDRALRKMKAAGVDVLGPPSEHPIGNYWNTGGGDSRD
jgi:hypothetical protein